MMAKMLFLAKANQFGLAELEKAMTDDSDDPEAYLMEADILFSQGFVSASKEIFLKAGRMGREWKPKEPNAKRQSNFEIKSYAGLAAVAEAQKDWKAAKGMITRWIDLDKDNPAAYLRLGRVQFKQDDLAGAMDSFKTAESLMNKKGEEGQKGTDPNIILAKLYLDGSGEKDDNVAGNRAKAIEALNKAVTAKPKSLETQLQAAAMYLQAKSLDKAQAAVDAAVTADSANVQAKYLKAVVMRMKKNLTESEKILEDLHQDSPGDFGITNQLALVLADSGRKEKEQKALQHAVTNFNNNPKNAEAACTLAWCTYKAGDKNKALQIMGEVAKQSQLSADSAYYIAVILRDMDKRDDAKKILTEAMKGDAPFFVHEQEAKDMLAKLSG